MRRLIDRILLRRPAPPNVKPVNVAETVQAISKPAIVIRTVEIPESIQRGISNGLKYGKDAAWM
jgi:hypothetical protein